MIMYGIYSDVTKCHILTFQEPENINNYLVTEFIIKDKTPLVIALKTALSLMQNIAISGESQQLIVLKVTIGE